MISISNVKGIAKTKRYWQNNYPYLFSIDDITITMGSQKGQVHLPGVDRGICSTHGSLDLCTLFRGEKEEVILSLEY